LKSVTVNIQSEKIAVNNDVNVVVANNVDVNVDDNVDDNDDDNNGVVDDITNGIDIVESNPTTTHNTTTILKTKKYAVVQKVTDNESSYNQADLKIFNLFRIMKAMNFRKKLESQYPILYMVSVDKVMNIESLKNSPVEIFAYVSGLAFMDDKLKVISLSKTPSITAESSSHVALVTSDIPLAFICITIVKAKTTFVRSEEPLGIVSVVEYFC